ncbi:unnamed protein product, partial [marine sediment metagenome]
PSPDIRVAFGYPLKKEGRERACQGTIGGYGVFTQTDCPEAAVKWIKKLTGLGHMLRVCSMIQFIPPRGSLGVKVAEEVNDSIFDRAVENSEWFHSYPVSPVGATAGEEIKVAIQEAVLGKKSPKEAITGAAKRINMFLTDYYEKH